MVNEQIYADNFSECFNQVAGIWNRPAPATINHFCSINTEVEPPDPVRLSSWFMSQTRILALFAGTSNLGD